MSRLLLLFWSLLLSLTTLREMVNGFSTLLSLSSAKSVFGKVVKNSTTSTTYLCMRGSKQQKRTMLSSSSSSSSSSYNIYFDSEDDPFTKLEYTNWQQGVDAYQKGFGPLTNQAVRQLLKQARFPFPTTTGDSSSSNNNNNNNKSNEPLSEYHLLDVACGPGQVLLEAISTTKTNFNFNHTFTGLDFSSNFIQLAKQNLKHHHHQQQQVVVEVDFVEGDAQNMSCFDENDKFDCVVCNFGILHLSSPSKFLEEAYRVLKPGGYIAYSVWSEPPLTEGFDLILNAIKECGNMDVKLPDGPPFFQYANFEESTKSLEKVGFESIEIIQYEEMIWSNVKSGQQLFDIFYEGTARTRELLMRQSSEQLSKIQQLLKEQFTLKTSKGPLKMPIVISSGMKPL